MDLARLHETLFSMQDTIYRDFHSALMPTIDKNTVIGIRVPVLRKFAKEFGKTKEASAFLEALPHEYYEENNLHGFLIEQINDYDKAIAELDKFLPYVDNWATCDGMNPKVLGKHPDRLIEDIKRWIADDRTYVKRYGIGMLMRHFLGDNFKSEYLDIVAEIRSDEYYINMMIAWFFATALAFRYESAVSYIKEYRLDTWTHNKAIGKAVESYRITDDKKAYLKTLRIKGV